MMHCLLAVAAVAVFGVVSAFPLSGGSVSIPVVPALNATAYLGRWYQVYEDQAENVAFELGAYCIAADYGLFPNGSVSVLNSNTMFKPNGKSKTIAGYAVVPDAKVPAKLQVHLDGVPFAAPYWVVQLGPQTYVGAGCPNPPCYQYAVVTDPFQVSLFVLARNPTTFFALYNATVFDALIAEGFTKSYDAPKLVYQNSDCVFIPEPSVL